MFGHVYLACGWRQAATMGPWQHTLHIPAIWCFPPCLLLLSTMVLGQMVNWWWWNHWKGRPSGRWFSSLPEALQKDLGRLLVPEETFLLVVTLLALLFPFFLPLRGLGHGIGIVSRNPVLVFSPIFPHLGSRGWAPGVAPSWCIYFPGSPSFKFPGPEFSRGSPFGAQWVFFMRGF